MKTRRIIFIALGLSDDVNMNLENSQKIQAAGGCLGCVDSLLDGDACSDWLEEFLVVILRRVKAAAHRIVLEIRVGRSDERCNFIRRSNLGRKPAIKGLLRHHDGHPIMNIRQRSRSILGQDRTRHFRTVAARHPQGHKPGEAERFLVAPKNEVRLLQRTDLARPFVGAFDGLPFIPTLSGNQTARILKGLTPHQLGRRFF